MLVACSTVALKYTHIQCIKQFNITTLSRRSINMLDGLAVINPMSMFQCAGMFKSPPKSVVVPAPSATVLQAWDNESVMVQPFRTTKGRTAPQG